MPRRLTNLLLLGLVPALIASGLAGWIWPVADVLLTYPLHRALGAALILVLGWKWAIAHDALGRRLRIWPADRSFVWGVVTAAATLATVGLGLAWTLGLISFEAFWGYSPLNVHVFIGIGLLVPLLAHAANRWEPRPPVGELFTRRSVLRLGGVALGSAAAAWLLGPSGVRRFTGSKHAGSFSGNDYPVTIWFLDPVPQLDAATWRMTVAGRVLTYEQLTKDFPRRELTAVLDCTGGWWSEQRWQGASVGDVLDALGVAPDAEQATVTSVTGHSWTFPLAELKSALLATHVGGEELTPGHGFPVRLAVPGRRGFQWVKWVDRIEVR
jgi:hypothetical protein